MSQAPVRLDQAIVEIVSDSGEGAQKAGQAFGGISAKMGNGVWTVEIIPAEIKPPARSREGASGIRIRLSSDEATNMGDKADLVVAFNEQVLFGRIAQGAYHPGTHVILENLWKDHPVAAVREAYAAGVADLRERGFVVHEIGMAEKCKEVVENPRVGKNMFVLGMLCRLYARDLDIAKDEVRMLFARKGDAVIGVNQRLLQAGYDFAADALPLAFEVPPRGEARRTIVCNGNQAIGLGVMASGMELVSMYPITPATSASHYLAGAYHRMGGVVHQAEDEIAAIGFAIGSSYAGKTACTITSGPGLALKTEFIGLAVMAEIPLVLVLVQRGGPSTGLPTKIEQGDLLASLYGEPGDSPKVIMAAATIEDCFHMPILARRLAEDFRTPVMILTDANLATGMAPMPRPQPQREWLAPPIDQSPWTKGKPAFDWDPDTGISPRPIPGQKDGMYTLTGLAHTRASKVAYDPDSNQLGCEARSRKLAALQATLKPPVVDGPERGKLLIVSWGSTLGAVREAVARVRGEGHSVASLHLRFLSPLEPGLNEILSRYDEIRTVELNYADPDEGPFLNEDNRRYAQLAMVLRAQTLRDVQSYAKVPGQPFSPGELTEVIRRWAEAAPATQTPTAPVA